MILSKVVGGTVHKMEPDIKKALLANPDSLKAWNNITPLARNEWICWNVTVSQAETRKNHIGRMVKELQQGKRRPCCWIGCIHRTDKAISPSVKGILSRRKKIN